MWGINYLIYMKTILGVSDLRLVLFSDSSATILTPRIGNRRHSIVLVLLLSPRLIPVSIDCGQESLLSTPVGCYRVFMLSLLPLNIYMKPLIRSSITMKWSIIGMLMIPNYTGRKEGNNHLIASFSACSFLYLLNIHSYIFICKGFSLLENPLRGLSLQLKNCDRC